MTYINAAGETVETPICPFCNLHTHINKKRTKFICYKCWGEFPRRIETRKLKGL